MCYLDSNDQSQAGEFTEEVPAINFGYKPTLRSI